MTAEAIALLIARYGIPMAERIWLIISNHVKDAGEPTVEMWAALRAEVSNTIEERLKQ